MAFFMDNKRAASPSEVAIEQMLREERAKCVVLHEGGRGGLHELPQSGLDAVCALARKLDAQTQVQGRDKRATGDARYAGLEDEILTQGRDREILMKTIADYVAKKKGDDECNACIETAAITGSAWMTLNTDGNSFTLRQHETHASSDTIREQATQSERARILAKLHELRPLDEPYSRRDWELERKGERRMLERITKAIESEQHPK